MRDQGSVYGEEGRVWPIDVQGFGDGGQGGGGGNGSVSRLAKENGIGSRLGVGGRNRFAQGAVAEGTTAVVAIGRVVHGEGRACLRVGRRPQTHIGAVVRLKEKPVAHDYPLVGVAIAAVGIDVGQADGSRLTPIALP